MVNLGGASKMLMALATKDFITSSFSSVVSFHHFRSITCASSSSTSTGRLVTHPPDLIRWVKSEGGFVHKGLKIADGDSNGLGLVSCEGIPKGSELIALPSHVPLRFRSLDLDDGDGLESLLLQLVSKVPGCIRHSQTIRECSSSENKIRVLHLRGEFNRVYILRSFSQNRGIMAQAIIARATEGSTIKGRIQTEELWAMRLGLKLLRERAATDSFWWPYISNLPETYSVPIFFPGEDIKNLQYAPLLHQVNKRCRFLLDFEKEIKNVLENVRPHDHPFGEQSVDASALGWAMSAVSSRAFRLHGERLPDGTQSYVPMMLPLIDMCNHSFNPNAQIVQEQDTSNTSMLVKVIAETLIKPNDPVLLNYGCLSNDFYLIDYGFVIPSNPYECIELKYDGALLDAASMAAGIESPNFSSPAPWQQQFLTQLNLQGESPNLKVSLGGSELVEGRLLAALRTLLSSDMESVKKHDLTTLKSLSTEAPLGISNEVAALRTVIALCVIALGHFPTKIMEDEQLLKGCTSGSTELALQFRIQKKSVIVDVMRNLTRRVKNLTTA